MTDCKECGAKMVKVGLTKDGIILRCTRNPNHEYEKKFTPEQKARQVWTTIGRSALNERKRAERVSKRRKKEKGSS